MWINSKTHKGGGGDATNLYVLCNNKTTKSLQMYDDL